MDHKDVTLGTFALTIIDTGLENENDPTANTYSIIGTFDSNKRESYKNRDGKFKLKLIFKYPDNSKDVLRWTQSSWITNATITGADLSDIPAENENVPNDGYKLYGLSYSSSPNAYLDGDGGKYGGWWFNAVCTAIIVYCFNVFT